VTWRAPRALAAMIRVDDSRAVRHVIATLQRAGGNVTETARALGCTDRTLYNWRDANDRLVAAFALHALGRTGAALNATRHRVATRKGKRKGKRVK